MNPEAKHLELAMRVAWMDFMQGCAKTGLGVWQELHWPPDPTTDTIKS